MHGAFLLVEGKKMNKSLGNFFTLRDLIAKGFTGREIRYLLLTAHYRETFNFTLDGLRGAKSSLARIDECVGKLREIERTGSWDSASTDAVLLKQFSGALDDDLNVSAAWSVVFEWIREINRRIAANTLTAVEAATALATWASFDRALGLELRHSDNLPEEILALAEARQAARKAKDFKRSDAIRDELKAKGWIIEDSPKGPKLKRL
jgi:cysteinyl-tRNA synthetase